MPYFTQQSRLEDSHSVYKARTVHALIPGHGNYQNIYLCAQF